MERACAPFAGKRITVMGLGLLGRGVGDVEFLAECGAQILVTDKKSKRELAESLARLKRFSNVEVRLGGHSLEDFTGADMVIKAAGVPLDSQEIAAAREHGVPVYMSTALFARYALDAGATLVGVTGTRGKTTTAQMIFHTLQKSGKRPHIGGNVRGKSTLAMLPDIHAGDIVVLELDSWQLQGFGDLGISPHVAVFTNLMPDHMNYYGGDRGRYFADKANIFRFQKAGDSLFVGAALRQRIPVGIVPQPLGKEWKLRVLGGHNLENASFAAAALAALGLSETEIRDGLESFEAVEGRLQFVREVRGVKIYNDNNATTPEATIAALRALPGPITLIAGGSEKELALDELVREIKGKNSSVVLLTHADYKGSERLARILRRESVAVLCAGSLEEALKKALSAAKTGTILFSPAFASFGMFKNEYERGDGFLRLVNTL
ncbi:MAG: hypothetical protein RLZZ416_104 [Candidatus Parcubacteria bacterium]|jgi:UDP-N-acetylmuramoylalanine--D-glutamate ligase